MTSIS